MKKILPSLLSRVCACSALLIHLLGETCTGATLTFDTNDAPGDGIGWWALERASSPSSRNSLTGYGINSDAPFPYPIIEYRAHLSFQITGINEPIQSAVLRLSQLASYSNGNQFSGIVTLGLFDVSTDPIVLNSTGGIQPDIFNDVGSGVSYGISVISITRDSARILEIPLNGAAMAAMQNGAVFSVGMRMLDGDGTVDHHLFANPGLLPDPYVHELRVVTGPVPEPSSSMLLAVGALFRRWRRAD